MKNFEIIPKIIGMSASIPKETFDLLNLGFDKDTMRRTMKLTGIHTVRLASENMTAADFCTAAAEKLIKDLSFDKSLIDGIIFATPHPDYIYPGNCSIIQSRLNLPKKCIAMDINHSCTGLIYAIFVAYMMIETGHCKNVLVCCGDTASKHINLKDRALRMVVGDGGGTALLTAGGEENIAFSFNNDGDGLKYLYTPAGGERMPIQPGTTDQEFADDDGNIRTLEEECMDGLEVMRFVINEMPPLVDDVLVQKSWNKDDVNLFAFHQANEFIVRSLAKRLKLSKDKVLLNVDDVGNIGGSSIAVAMCRDAKGKSQNWIKTVFCSFGTGMSGAAMAVNLSDTYFCEISEI